MATATTPKVSVRRSVTGKLSLRIEREDSPGRPWYRSQVHRFPVLRSAYRAARGRSTLVPTALLGGPWRKAAERGLRQYEENGYDYLPNMVDYTAHGNYLNYDKTLDFDSDVFRRDDTGLPLVRVRNSDGEADYHHPVAYEQFALGQQSRYLACGDETARNKFLLAVDRLLNMQDSDGAFRYPFKRKHHLCDEESQPGWVSGLAQGQALSVFSRAFLLTEDKTFLGAGAKAFQFMVKPVSKGGTLDTLSTLHPSLGGCPFVQEWITAPASYTLNGFQYTLLGLYDWWQLGVQVNEMTGRQARDLFRLGFRSLKKVLPLYDIGGFTAYDLSHVTYAPRKPHISPRYHALHIYLLHALWSITGDRVLLGTKGRWAAYVD